MTLALHEEKRGTTALNACKGRKGEIGETEEACSGRDILLYTGVFGDRTSSMPKRLRYTEWATFATSDCSACLLEATLIAQTRVLHTLLYHYHFGGEVPQERVHKVAQEARNRILPFGPHPIWQFRSSEPLTTYLQDIQKLSNAAFRGVFGAPFLLGSFTHYIFSKGIVRTIVAQPQY